MCPTSMYKVTCYFGCPRTLYIDQAGFSLTRDLPASASGSAGIKGGPDLHAVWNSSIHLFYDPNSSLPPPSSHTSFPIYTALSQVFSDHKYDVPVNIRKKKISF